MNRDANVLAVFLVAIVAIVGVYIIGGWIVSLAWNGVMPYLFGFRTIDMWQGVALAYLFAQISGFTGKTSSAITEGYRNA